VLRFADYIAIIAENEKDLQKLIKTMDKTINNDLKMKLNVQKTKVFVCGRKNRTRLHIKLDELMYQGSTISNDERNKKEIINRICQAKIAFNRKKTLHTSKNISLKIRKNILKTYVLSIALYGCKIWTISMEERKKLEAFEMWSYRRKLKISWMDRITNKEVLEK